MDNITETTAVHKTGVARHKQVNGMSVINLEALKKSHNKIPRAHAKLRILQRDKYACVWCQAKDNLTIDHKEPRKNRTRNKASDYRLEDCQTLCVTCHLGKNDGLSPCHKCRKGLGEYRVPYLYMDRNDERVKDEGDGYRQYYVCVKCKDEEESHGVKGYTHHRDLPKSDW